MVRVRNICLAIIATLISPLVVQADPISYELTGVDFINGNGSVTGSFTFDSETGQITDIDVTAEAGRSLLCTPGAGCAGTNIFVAGAFASTTFMTSTNGFDVNGSTNFRFFSETAPYQLVMRFAGAFPDAGGIVPLVFAAQWECPSPDFCNRDIFNTPFRTAVVGEAVAATVPEPGTLGLLGLGLLGIAMSRRRKLSHDGPQDQG